MIIFTCHGQRIRIGWQTHNSPPIFRNFQCLVSGYVGMNIPERQRRSRTFQPNRIAFERHFRHHMVHLSMRWKIVIQILLFRGNKHISRSNARFAKHGTHVVRQTLAIAKTPFCHVGSLCRLKPPDAEANIHIAGGLRQMLVQCFGLFAVCPACVGKFVHQFLCFGIQFIPSQAELVEPFSHCFPRLKRAFFFIQSKCPWRNQGMGNNQVQTAGIRHFLDGFHRVYRNRYGFHPICIRFFHQTIRHIKQFIPAPDFGRSRHRIFGMYQRLFIVLYREKRRQKSHPVFQVDFPFISNDIRIIGHLQIVKISITVGCQVGTVCRSLQIAAGNASHFLPQHIVNRPFKIGKLGKLVTPATEQTGICSFSRKNRHCPDIFHCTLFD